VKAAAARRRLNALCPLHGVRFGVSGDDGAIQCEAAPHLLADDYPVSQTGFFELCSACDTLWPFTMGSPAAQCLYCGTSAGRRSLCGSCSVFTLPPDGVLSVACAGCGAIRQNEQLHRCDEGGDFVSSRAECPFCLDAIVAARPFEVAPLAVPRPRAKPKPQPVVSAPTPEAAPAQPIAPELPHERQTPGTKTSLIAAAVLIVLAIVAASVYFSLDTFTSRIDKALAAHRYFPPDADSVYDIYTAEATKHPESAEVKAAAAKIAATLGPEADAQLASFYKDSEMKFRWSELARDYAFLETLNPADRTVKAKHLYGEGQRALLEQHDFRVAYGDFTNALSADERFVLAVNGIAKLYIQESSPFHDDAAAVRWYERAISTDPNFTWAAKNLGEYYMHREQWDRAEYYMSHALLTSPGRSSILGALGRIAFNRRHYAEARDYYSRALQSAKNPDEIRRYNHALQQVREKL